MPEGFFFPGETGSPRREGRGSIQYESLRVIVGTGLKRLNLSLRAGAAALARESVFSA